MNTNREAKKSYRDLSSMLYVLGREGCLNWLSDALYLKILYRLKMGKPLDIEKPATFNEKIQWLKLYDHNPLYTTLVDKYAVKRFVSAEIGEEYVTPTYASWSRAEDIDLNVLPERFVLKTNHDCGGIAICRKKSEFNFSEAKRILKEHMNRNYYWSSREWPYKNVKPLIFAEEYIEPVEHISEEGLPEGLVDYKFYCFGGVPQFLYISKGLEVHETARISFLNTDWTFAQFHRNDYFPFEELPSKPESYDEMLQLASVLSANMPFVRVDFFEYEHKPRFSEFTLHPCSGFMGFQPVEWDRRIGELLDLTYMVQQD